MLEISKRTGKKSRITLFKIESDITSSFCARLSAFTPSDPLLLNTLRSFVKNQINIKNAQLNLDNNSGQFYGNFEDNSIIKLKYDKKLGIEFETYFLPMLILTIRIWMAKAFLSIGVTKLLGIRLVKETSIPKQLLQQKFNQMIRWMM